MEPVFFRYEFTFSWRREHQYFMRKIIITTLNWEGADKQAYLEALKEFYRYLQESGEKFIAPESLIIGLEKGAL